MSRALLALAVSFVVTGGALAGPFAEAERLYRLAAEPGLADADRMELFFGSAVIITLSGPVWWRSESVETRELCEARLVRMMEFITVAHHGRMLESECRAGSSANEIITSASGVQLNWTDLYLVLSREAAHPPAQQ
jgi:hypothetical protein